MNKEAYLEYWKELNNSVQDLIKVTQFITTGAENKKGVWDMTDQYKHINQEVHEALMEYLSGNSSDDEIDEDMDILMTALTIFHKKGYTAMDIKFSTSRMIKKYVRRRFLKF